MRKDGDEREKEHGGDAEGGGAHEIVPLVGVERAAAGLPCLLDGGF